MKYLNHNFVEHGINLSKQYREVLDEDYLICEKCKIILLKCNEHDMFKYNPYISNYYLRENSQKTNLKLTLTCEEVQIKTLLE